VAGAVPGHVHETDELAVGGAGGDPAERVRPYPVPPAGLRGPAGGGDEPDDLLVGHLVAPPDHEVARHAATSGAVPSRIRTYASSRSPTTRAVRSGRPTPRHWPDTSSTSSDDAIASRTSQYLRSAGSAASTPPARSYSSTNRRPHDGPCSSARFTAQCATSRSAGPHDAVAQSTTPATSTGPEPENSTFPGWKSRCRNRCSGAGRGPRITSRAAAHTASSAPGGVTTVSAVVSVTASRGRRAGRTAWIRTSCRASSGTRAATPSSVKSGRPGRCVMRSDGCSQCAAAASTPTRPGAVRELCQCVRLPLERVARRGDPLRHDEAAEHQRARPAVGRGDGQPEHAGGEPPVQRLDGGDPLVGCEVPVDPGAGPRQERAGAGRDLGTHPVTLRARRRGGKVFSAPTPAPPRPARAP